ncbi:hypothetical protein Cni_G29475 [Canna indica]|uniref:START domain-containing protein n=1 Tax=Canna indica TaxID=4628 RepID=A0AAQ3QU19_9LILI|nr:hypothetical protein Cni_G29475 [Canna indica]
MDKKTKILELRERMDKTLALPDLANEESIKSLVKKQLQCSSLSQIEEGDVEQIVGKRTREACNFLEMLRSASENERKDRSHSDWKVKQDTEQLRVMYREGPHGTPFHTLLCEGYVDGPIDVCLCVSWETTLYSKWWPQYNLPTFKIIMSTCLQKVQVGEEISLVRVKVPWPVSDREALLCYFEIEFLEEDLILVLTNTIPDTEHTEVSTNDFSRNAIPEATRIDMVGGFVLQKVDCGRSYFRAIANMDIKLDFVPPSLINFISRQLIGNGHKLYQKAVRTVANTDKDYQKALEGPMYARIRQGLNHRNKKKKDVRILEEERIEGALLMEQKSKSANGIRPITDITSVTEIMEEETEHSERLLKSDQLNNGISTDLVTKQQDCIVQKAYISPEVEAALATLDNAIAVLRSGGSSNNQMDCSSIDEGLPANEASPEDSETKSPARDFRNIPCRHSTETSAFKKLKVFGHETVALSSSSLDNPILSVTASTKRASIVHNGESIKAHGFHAKGPQSGNSKHAKKKWFCCLGLAR